MITENPVPQRGSSSHGYLMDKDLGMPLYDDCLGRISSEYMYSTNCPEITNESGIWDFLIAMDQRESLFIQNDHKIFLESKETADRSVRRTIIVSTGVAFLVSIPITLTQGKSAGMITCSTINTITSGMGAINAYLYTKKISREIEDSRVKRLSEKIDTMRSLFNSFKSDNRKQDMKDLVKVKKFFSYAIKNLSQR